MESVFTKMAFQWLDILCYCIFFKVILDPVLDSLRITESTRMRKSFYLFVLIAGASTILKSIDFFNALGCVT